MTDVDRIRELEKFIDDLQAKHLHEMNTARYEISLLTRDLLAAERDIERLKRDLDNERFRQLYEGRPINYFDQV